ncbi:restriction endonuclease [Azospirillum sp. B4]|uniref:restriction endonuclease n=1 Tax=Azospirillum sp. B4 TaxID=95605 RepID=UPI00034CB4A6|nr:restriction endonuclease [Azospirillum sp. B4]
MPIPDYQAFMLPLLQLAAKGEQRVADTASFLADMFGVTLEERTQVPANGGQPVLNNRMHWAKTYLTKAGLLDNPRRGWFVATDAGRQLLATAPERLSVRDLLQYPSFRAFYRGTTQAGDDAANGESKAPLAVADSVSTPEEQVEAAHLAIQTALKADLLARILQNSPTFFERIIVDLLVSMGYGGSQQDAAARLTPRTGDGGIDGVINEDPLGLDRVYVQAKRYQPGNAVHRPEVQAFVGSLVGEGASKGVFVTTSTFSTGAADFARHLPQRIILIDGQRLTDLMVAHNVGVKVARSVEFKRIDEDFFADEA